MRTQPVDGIGMEVHVGIDPHCLLIAVDQGVGRHLVPALVDGRVAANPPHVVASPLQFLQSPFARRNDRETERNEDHTSPGVHRAAAGTSCPSPLWSFGRIVDMRPHVDDLSFGRDSREGEQVLQACRSVERLIGVENANMVRVEFPKLFDLPIVFIPIAADAFFAILRFVLRIGRRPKRIVVPAGRGPIGPMVGRQRKARVQPFAETTTTSSRGRLRQGCGYPARRRLPLQDRADRTTPRRTRFDLDRSGETARSARERRGLCRRYPRQKRRLFIRRLCLRLLVEELCQRSQSTTARSNAEDNRLFHRMNLEAVGESVLA